jgi:hypothetical protein
MDRVCLSCTRMKTRDAYSDYQWAEGKLSKCRRCVLGVPEPADQPPATMRLGTTRAVAADMREPSRHGDQYLATSAALSGSDLIPCIAKWYRPAAHESEGLMNARYEQSRMDMKNRVLHRAVKLVAAFNASRSSRTTVRVNLPSTMRARGDGGLEAFFGWQTDAPVGQSHEAALRPGEETHVEVRLASWQKWSSNTGWASDDAPSWVAELTHHSFHSSGGECLLCDIAGCEVSVWEDGVAREAIIGDPTIHSRGRSFGPTDLGLDGILSWFARHECTEACMHMLRPPVHRTMHANSEVATLTLQKETLSEEPQILPPSVLAQMPVQQPTLGARSRLRSRLGAAQQRRGDGAAQALYPGRYAMGGWVAQLCILVLTTASFPCLVSLQVRWLRCKSPRGVHPSRASHFGPFEGPGA